MSLPLLAPCEHELSRLYYQQVLGAVGNDAIEVQHDIEGKGKGLVATKLIPEGETVFTERPLVSLQHLDNKDGALVCDKCLRFIGSIEKQIGHKLQRLVDHLRASQGDSAQGQDEGQDADEEVDLDAALEAGERLEQIYSHVTPERIAELSSGAVTLPMTEDFQLPALVPCRRGCGAQYCSARCEDAAWEHHHCLLCAGTATTTTTASALATESTGAGPSTGPPAPDASAGAPPSLQEPAPSAAPPSAAAGSTAAPAAAAGLSSAPIVPSSHDGGSPAAAGGAAGPSSSASGGIGGSGSTSSAPDPATEELHGIRVDRRAVAAFADHARSTNEIFLLAAQVVAATLLQAARLLTRKEGDSVAAEEGTTADALRGEGNGGAAAPAAAGSGAGSSAAPGGVSGGGDGAGLGSGSSSDACRAALLAAWRPYSCGWKRCWWESVAVPDDVDDAEEFRAQLKELASDSLELLSAAITDPRFGSELMQLEVYGSIVGMFELNNLGLSICSPVEDYFLAVDEMDEGAAKMEVVKVTQPLLDALDTEYATPCEATAFMALQSCINHSCDPNCTTACDTGDRTVTVLAQRDIEPGEEITLSYIDVSLPYKQRQAELRDYGFVCRCSRCVGEAAAARVKRQGAAGKGVKVGAGGRRR